jgi:parallel beta-helix repeat protein
VKAIKVVFLFFIIVTSLCAFNTLPVKSQETGYILISSDGSISTSTNVTVPIQRVGNVYTFTGDISGYALWIQRNNIIVDGAGYALSGFGNYGIDMTNANNVTIKNMQVGGFTYSIYILNSVGNTITGNTVTNSGNGIILIYSSQNTITDNTLTNNEIGIELRFSTQNTLRNNGMNNNHRNLAVHGTEISHFINDIDNSNTINGKKVYYLINENDLVINPSTHPDLGFLALVSCRNITVQNLEFTQNGQGVIVASTTGSTITGNTIIDNYVGLILFSSSNNYIIGNYITTNLRGIQLSSSSMLNGITSNNITDNKEGISFFKSTQNTISINNITNNDLHGLGFSESSGNIIRGNFFIDNLRQVYDYATANSSIVSSTNFWGFGYPAGGNYWSDYTGIDLKSGPNQDEEGSDGLGDTSYVIYGNEEDEYPILPFGSPPVITINSPENKTYDVTFVTLTYSVNVPTSRVAYSLDGQAQVEFTGSKTISELAFGSHSLTIYARDEDGAENSATVYFTVAQGASPPQPGIPITWVAAIIVIVVAGAILVFYFIRNRKKKHYSGVKMQQGRVKLDSDQNE